MKSLFVGFIAFLTIAILFSGCRRKKKSADAYGVFEATEITVSSESNGRLLEFNVEEGQLCHKGDILGYIDSAQICLQIQQLESAIRATLASRPPDLDTFFNILRIFLIFSIVLRHPKIFFKERLDLLVPFCKE